MNLQIINNQLASLLENKTTENSINKFTFPTFKKKIEESINQLSKITYLLEEYFQLIFLHQKIRQLRMQKKTDLGMLELIDLERLIGFKALHIKAGHLNFSLDCIKTIQWQRETRWPHHLGLLGRAFKIKEPFIKFKSILKARNSWETCRKSFYAALKKEVNEKQAAFIMDVIERTYAVFRQIHLKEEMFILDYYDGSLKAQEELESYSQIEDQLERKLQSYTKTTRQMQSHKIIGSFLNALSHQRKNKDKQAYLMGGVCIGSTLDYIESKLENKKKSVGMQISPQARYYQLCHNLSMSHLFTFNATWHSYMLQKAYLEETSQGNTKQKEELNQKIDKFLDLIDINYEQLMLPAFLLKKLKIKMEQVIGLGGSQIAKTLSVEEFILNALPALVQHYQEEDSSHFILILRNLASKPLEPEHLVPNLKSVEEKTESIIGLEEVPASIQNRIKSKLIEGEGTTGHAVYLSLTAPYEFQDPNIPNFEGLRSSNLENFKLMLLTWFSCFPYQTISGVFRVQSDS